ncbi:MAG TPA: hypothetical protein DCS93_30080 [Microscillaceae bacterium]|nr:hypothetical protein [Microscillaceae bacterium]
MKKKSKYGMPPPSSRIEFEHNIDLLLENAKGVIDSGNKDLIRNKLWATLPHLKKVSSLPNGRMDLNTVNEMLTLQGNMMDWMKYDKNNTKT